MNNLNTSLPCTVTLLICNIQATVMYSIAFTFIYVAVSQIKKWLKFWSMRYFFKFM